MTFSEVEAGKRARFRVSAIVFAALTILAVAAVLVTPPRSDSRSYFAFADQRTLLGVRHFMDVISNAPFALIGIAGLLVAARRGVGPGGPFSESWERRGTMVLFAAVLGVSIGSAWFHYTPGPRTLVWDRLPMAIIFMSFFGLTIGDRIGLRAGRALFWPLVAFGILSVAYWRHTETLGRGDFRFYMLVQFYPMLAIPFMLGAFPARYTRAGGIWLGLGSYGLAKLFELADARVFALTRVVSGHTLKHLAAAAAVLSLLRAIQRRRPVYDR